MSRFQQKCIIASGGAHLLLAVVLVVGPGFLSPSAKPVDATPITFIPSLLVADGPPGGGNPKAGQPMAAPPKPPAPEPKPVAPEPKPEPVVEKVTKPEPKEEPKDKDAFAISEKPHKPVVSLERVTRTHKKPKTDDSEADAKAQEQERRDYERRQRIASLIGHAASDIKSGTGAAVDVAGEAGPGGGGPAYSSYASWVSTVYDQAWIAPDDATSEDATVKVKVVIANDGSVEESRIIQRSGDAAVDASVQRALERVARAGMGRPFPASMKDKHRTYIIPFNVRTKRGTA